MKQVSIRHKDMLYIGLDTQHVLLPEVFSRAKVSHLSTYRTTACPLVAILSSRHAPVIVLR
jgi:hypothetical protein